MRQSSKATWRALLANPELRAWVSVDYLDGFVARHEGKCESRSATLYWCLGWQDADIELGEAVRVVEAAAAGSHYDFPDTWRVLNGAGTEARLHGIPFNEARTAPWKEGWIEADISWGMMLQQKDPSLSLLIEDGRKHD